MVSGKIRLKFHKTGRLKFISHLDLMRTVQAAILRAKIPIYYTEGFNPHPKMVFALPVALGDESVCEYLDIRLNEPMEPEALLTALNAQFPPELRFVECYARESEHDFHEICTALYRFTFRETDRAAVAAAMEGELPVVKKSKKGMVEVDLRPNVVEYRFEDVADGFVMEAKLNAGEFNFVNPENLVKALREKTGLPIDDYDVLRTAVLLSDGSNFR